MGKRTWNHYTKEFKFKVAIAAIKGQKSDQDPAAVSEELVKTIGHQTIQIDWLKKARALRVVARRSMIEPDQRLSVQEQCRLLSLSRSGYYYLPSQETELNLRLLRRIDEINIENPTWGSRMLRDRLAMEGDVVNRKRIKRLMAILRIKVIYPARNLSKRNQEHKVYLYLLRGLAINRPSQVWSTGITYIRLRRGWTYLVAVLDWSARAVLSWRLSNTCDRFFCIEAVEEALRVYGTPEIFITDQGATFTRPGFTKVLVDAGGKAQHGRQRSGPG